MFFFALYTHRSSGWFINGVGKCRCVRSPQALGTGRNMNAGRIAYVYAYFILGPKILTNSTPTPGADGGTQSIIDPTVITGSVREYRCFLFFLSSQALRCVVSVGWVGRAKRLIFSPAILGLGGTLQHCLAATRKGQHRSCAGRIDSFEYDLHRNETVGRTK